MTWLRDTLSLLHLDERVAPLLAALPAEHQELLAHLWLDLSGTEPLADNRHVSLPELCAHIQSTVPRHLCREDVPDAVIRCGFAFAAPHQEFDAFDPVQAGLWLSVCQAAMLLSCDDRDHLEQVEAGRTHAPMRLDRNWFHMLHHLEWWQALKRHGLLGWYPAGWKRRADDDQWVAALYLWFAIRARTLPHPLAAGLHECQQFIAEHGPRWRHELVQRAGGLIGAVQLVLHNREPWAILVFLGRAPEALTFTAWSELRAMAYALGDESKPWNNAEWPDRATHLAAYARLAATFGPRTLPVVQARLAKRVATDVEAPVDVTEDPRSRLYAMSVLASPPYTPAAVDWMFARRNAHDWDEVLFIGKAWDKLQLEGREPALEQLRQQIHTGQGESLLVLHRTTPENIARWRTSLTADRGIYPVTLRTSVGVLSGSILPRNDPRGALLGHYTSCCQHIDGHASRAAWHSQESQWGGVFAAFFGPHLLAGSWLWLQPHLGGKTVAYAVFDSLEVKVEWRDRLGRNPEQQRGLWALYLKAALQLYRQFPETVGVLLGPSVLDVPFRLASCPADETKQPYLQRHSTTCVTDITHSGSWLIPPQATSPERHVPGHPLRLNDDVLDTLWAVADNPDALLQAVGELHGAALRQKPRQPNPVGMPAPLIA